MKIGFDAKRLFCNDTGLGNYSRTLVCNLATHHPQNDYHLYTPTSIRNAKTSFFFNALNIQTHCPSTLFKSYWRSFSVVKQLQKDGIQLYHGLSHELPFGIHKTSIKSIVTIHDLIFKIYPETYHPIDRKIYDWKFRYSCEHADKIIAISESTKKDIIHYYNIPEHKIEVIYQACDPIYYQPASIEFQQKIIHQYALPTEFILYVGTVQERKNLKLLIQSYQHLSQEYQRPIVVVGNGGSYKKEVLQLIEKMGLNHLVFWVDNLADTSHLQALYQAASLFVYPSFYEGFGLPVAEALLSKTAVITSKISALPEAGGPHSLLIDPSNEKALAVGIQDILSNKELSSKMISNGFDFAQQQFNSKLLSQQLLDCYHSIL